MADQPKEIDPMERYLAQERRRKAEGKAPHGASIVIGFILVLVIYAVGAALIWG